MAAIRDLRSREADVQSENNGRSDETVQLCKSTQNMKEINHQLSSEAEEWKTRLESKTIEYERISAELLGLQNRTKTAEANIVEKSDENNSLLANVQRFEDDID